MGWVGLDRSSQEKGNDTIQSYPRDCKGKVGQPGVSADSLRGQPGGLQLSWTHLNTLTDPMKATGPSEPLPHSYIRHEAVPRRGQPPETPTGILLRSQDDGHVIIGPLFDLSRSLLENLAT